MSRDDDDDAWKPGTASLWINDPMIRSQPNVVTLFVSATPYNLVSKYSQITRANTESWFAPGDSSPYYGLQQYKAPAIAVKFTSSITPEMESKVKSVLEQVTVVDRVVVVLSASATIGGSTDQEMVVKVISTIDSAKITTAIDSALKGSQFGGTISVDHHARNGRRVLPGCITDDELFEEAVKKRPGGTGGQATVRAAVRMDVLLDEYVASMSDIAQKGGGGTNGVQDAGKA